MIADQSQGAGRHECSEKRFDSYDTSQLPEDRSDIKTFSSKAARGLRNQPAQDAEFGEFAPMSWGPASRRAAYLVSYLARVSHLEIATQRFGETRPVRTTMNVHGQSSERKGSG